MAQWPDVPLTTYIANSPPAIKAFDLNAFQTEINRLYGSLIGEGGFLLSDDFHGPFADATALGNTVGQSLQIGSINNVTVTNAYDSITPLPGGPGVALFFQTAAAAPSFAVAQSCTLNLGTKDLILSARVTVPVKANLDISGTGFFASGAARSISIFARDTQANWRYIDDANVEQDSGVAVVDGALVNLQAIRIGGMLTYYINGTAVTSFASSTLGASSRVGIQTQGKNIAPGTVYSQFDYVHFWCSRT